MRRKAFFALGFSSIVGAAACSAIIGTRDLTLVSGDSGAPSNGDAQIVNDAGAGDATCSSSDLQTDQNNCGTCGHSCLGGACMVGACQAFTLVPAQLGAVGIAADTTSLYWTTLTTPQVTKANKDGTGVTALASPAQGTLPFDIAIDDTYVYWTDNEDSAGSVNRCPKAGGKASILTPQTLDEAFGVAVDGTNVYWAEGEGNAVGRVPKGGGAGFGYLATQLYGGYEVALDDASVYFATADTVQSTAKNGPVVGDPINDTTDAAALTTFYTANSDTQPYGITTDATNVYWTVQLANLVQYAPRGGGGAGGPMTLATGENGPIMITTDATNVYWTATGPNTGAADGNAIFVSGYVAMCPKTGCPSSGSIKLATGLHNPYGIVVDDTAIYFTIDGNVPDGQEAPTEGSVMKIAK